MGVAYEVRKSVCEVIAAVDGDKGTKAIEQATAKFLVDYLSPDFTTLRTTMGNVGAIVKADKDDDRYFNNFLAVNGRAQAIMQAHSHGNYAGEDFKLGLYLLATDLVVMDQLELLLDDAI